MHKSLKCKRSLSLFCAITLLFASVAAAIPIHSFADNSPAVWDGTSSTAPTKGSGSESDPYIIETAAELYNVVFEVGDNTKNKYYQLANDIYLNDTSKADWESNSPNVWESTTSPNNDTNFLGHFDGNGYVVHGIYTDITGKEGWYKAALFPRVYVLDSDISIKNVGVEDSSVNGCFATAAIVGQISGSDTATERTVTVSGCYADESVKVNGTNNVGGLVGLVDFKGNFKLENCFSRVHLNYSGTKVKSEDIGLGYGSLVGWFMNDVDSSKRQFTNCYAVVFNEDFTEGFNIVPVGSWGDKPIMEHVTYSGTSGSNEDNTGKVQRGEHQKWWVPQRWVTDFKGTSAKEKLPGFDWENIWLLGKNGNAFISLKIFNHPKKPSDNAEVWDGTSSTAPTKGNGSESDPYIIETAAELYNVVFEAGDGTKNKYYQLANDIYLNDTAKADWESNSPNVWESTTSPNNDTNFLGHFDGNGYVVHGIYTDITGKEVWYKAALFPRVYVLDSDISIKNVGVEDSSVNGCFATAAIVGQISGSDSATERTVTVSGCYADESVKVNGTNNVGGLVGLVDFKGNFKLENCFSRVHLNYSGTKVKSEDIGLGYGSLVGWFMNDVDSSKRQFTNCYAVVYNEDYEEGFNTVPVGSWGDEPIMQHVTYSGTSGSNEDNTAKVQRGGHQQYWVPQRWVTDFKGTSAQGVLTTFDFENIWALGKNGNAFISLKIFAKNASSDVPKGVWSGSAQAPTTGSGTEDNPILLENGEQLYYVLQNGNQTAGKYYKITKDIVLNVTEGDDWYEDANNWYPTSEQPFQGVLDGDGHIIKGLFACEGNVALIPKVSAANSKVVIKNLGIETAHIESTNNKAGILITEVTGDKGVTVSTCYAAEDVTVSSTAMVGFVANVIDGHFTMDNCYTLATHTKGEANAELKLGSLIGRVEQGEDTKNPESVYISDSYAVVTDGYAAVDESFGGARCNFHNVYSTVEPKKTDSGYYFFNLWQVTFVEKENLVGESAVAFMSKLDYDNVWLPVKNNYPTLQIFQEGSSANNDAFNGEGTEAKPYLIEDADQLATLRALPAKQTQGNYYKLTNNITVTDSDDAEKWGMNIAASFNGHFDGDGYTVSGLHIEDALCNVAFFGKLGNNAVVENLRISDCYFKGETAGAIAAIVNGTYVTIQNCFVEEDVTVIANKNAGGILGYLSNNSFTMHNCGFVGKVATSSQTEKAAGLIGGLSKVANSVAYSTISTSYAVTTDNDPAFNLNDRYNGVCIAGVYSNVEFPRDQINPDSIAHIDFYVLEKSQLTGASAANNMTLLDFSGAWTTREGKLPALRFTDDIPENAGTVGKVWSGKIAKNYASGTGTPNDPYKIKTAEQLALMVYTSVMKPFETNGKYYTLEADIILNDVSAEEWYNSESANEWFHGYGYSSKGFLGNFYGNGHTVEGILYNNVRNTQSYGFIPTIGGSAVIDGVAVKNLYSQTGDGAFGTLGSISGFVSYSSNGTNKPTISRCIADDTNIFGMDCSLGGILGHACRGIKIENCLSLVNFPYRQNRGTILGTSDCASESVEISNCVAIQEPSGRSYAYWASESSNAIDPEITNLYVTYASNGLLATPRSKMIGDKAKSTMSGLDWNNVWMTADNATPTLRLFSDSKYSKENQKVTISFFTNGGSILEEVSGYPGEKIPMPDRASIIRDADEFDGWYLENTLLRKFNTDVFPEYDAVLFAKWVSKTIVQDFETYPYHSAGDEGLGYDYERFRPGTSGFNFNKVNDGLTSVHRKGAADGEQDFLIFQEDFEPLKIGQEYTMTFTVYVESANDANGIIKLIHTDYLDINELPYQIDEICTLGSLKTGKWQEVTVKFIANGYYLSIRTPGLSSLYFDSFRIVPTNTGFKYTDFGNGNDSSSSIIDNTGTNTSIIVNTGTNAIINDVNDTDKDNNSDNSNTTKQKKKKLVKVISDGDMDLTFLYWLIPVAVVVSAAGAVLIVYFVKKKRK